jgi:hypothetical protein
MKFGQNLNKKQLKLFLLKNNRKNLFGPQPNAAHGLLCALGALGGSYWLPLPRAAQMDAAHGPPISRRSPLTIG